MEEILLLKLGEAALKGLNRSTFEDQLKKNVRRRLSSLGKWEVWSSQSTVYVTPQDPVDMEEAAERVSRVFGVAGLSRARAVEKNMDAIKAGAIEYLKETLGNLRTFKVEAKRSDKTFPLKSPELCAELGGSLLQQFPHLKVDVHHPDFVVVVEIRERGAYIHGPQIPGAGGLPVGSSGRAALLISGGIDSPVAGWMMAKRGLELTAVHFESPPYTSERAKEKVLALLKKLTPWCGRIRCYVVPFTEIQEQIREKCPEELFTLIMRRFMMRIAEAIALDNHCGALITGESLAQVASQTMYAIGCTDSVTSLPVFRPAIGLDKLEIVDIARKIDTFETSILPYEDCCTVFTPRHPRTRARPELCQQAETALDIPGLCGKCLKNIEVLTIYE